MNDNIPTKVVREPLASPFEVAQLAVSIASLHGHKEPDLNAAIALLLKAHFRVRLEKRPPPDCAGYATEVIHDGDCMPAHPLLTENITPQTTPEKFAARMKSFPGAESIQQPTKDRWTLMEIIQAVSGRRGRKENERLIEAATIGGIIKDESFLYSYSGQVTFWSLARDLAPFAPRFRKLYNDQQKPLKVKRKRNSKGQLHTAKRGEDGKFKKVRNSKKRA